MKTPNYKLNQFSINALINARRDGFSLSKWIVDRFRESGRDGETLQSFAHRIGLSFL